MVASSARSLVLLLCIGVAAPVACSADEVKQVEVQEKAAALAKKELLHEIPVMGKAIDACDAKRQVIEIPHRDELGVSRRALLLGLDYFHRRNNNACLASAAQRYSLAKWVYDKSLTVRGESQEPIEGLGLMDAIMEEWWNELQAKTRYYEEVSEAERARIERLNHGKRPVTKPL